MPDDFKSDIPATNTGYPAPGSASWTKVRDIALYTTAVSAIVGALSSSATYVGKGVISIHDFQRTSEELGKKMDDLADRFNKSDQDQAGYRNYTDARFSWIGERVTVLEQGRALSQTPPASTPTPTYRPRR